MLLIIKSAQEMDIPQLLAIYRESSLENCQGMYPEEPTPEAAGGDHPGPGGGVREHCSVC